MRRNILACIVLSFSVYVTRADHTNDATNSATLFHQYQPFTSKVYIDATIKEDEESNILVSSNVFTVTIGSQTIPVTRVQPVGFGPTPTQYHEVYLSGRFEPGEHYKLTIALPNQPVETVDITLDVSATNKLIFGVFDTRTNGPTHLTFSPLSTDNAQGFQYDASLELYWASLPSDQFRLSISSKGELSFENSKTNKLLNELDGGMKAQYHRTYVDWNHHSYEVNFSLQPVDMESTKDFKTVNYTTKLQGEVASVPLTDRIQYWWDKMTGLNEPYEGAVITTGYTFAKNVTNPGTGSTSITNRWDSEVNYTFEFCKYVDLSAKYQSYVDLGGGKYHGLEDFKMIIYFSPPPPYGHTSRFGIFGEFLSGEAPPAFQKASSFRLGATKTF